MNWSTSSRLTSPPSNLLTTNQVLPIWTSSVSLPFSKAAWSTLHLHFHIHCKCLWTRNHDVWYVIYIHQHLVVRNHKKNVFVYRFLSISHHKKDRLLNSPSKTQRPIATQVHWRVFMLLGSCYTIVAFCWLCQPSFWTICLQNFLAGKLQV